VEAPVRFTLTIKKRNLLTAYNSEEEDPEEYSFPLTLKFKNKSPGSSSPAINGPTNGIS
jgi:hypothetical protein